MDAFDSALSGASAQNGTGGAVGRLTQDVASLGPLAQTYHSATPDIPVANYQPSTSSQSNVSKFSHFLGGALSETGHIAEGVGTWLGRQALSIPQGIEHYGAGLAHGFLDQSTLRSLDSQNKQNSLNLENTINAFKSGRMSQTEYRKELFNISQNNDNLVSQQIAFGKQLTLDKNQATQGLISTASTLVTILTAGFGKAAAVAVGADGIVPITEKSAADWIASKAADPIFASSEKLMANAASDSKVFAMFNKTSQWALQKSMAEVVSTGEAMTKGQIARATVANVALKYPIYYNMISSQADTVYKELDQKKYGDAVRTVAFTAMLSLSGGPIGQALKYGGNAVKSISARSFGQTSFWDELSKSYGDQNPAGFRNAVVKAVEGMAPAERDNFIKNLSSVEATNLGATGGDAVAAASRVAKGMTSYDGINLSTISHEEALANMVNAFTVQREVDVAAEGLGLGKTAVGRLDARSKSEIAKQLMGAEDKNSRLALWEQMKQENPGQAWANNQNFDTQIKALIDSHENGTALAEKILGINAATSVEGFPKALVEKWAKQGYVPIQPRVNEAPFKEGTGVITSKFAGEGDVWTKAVAPVPILSEIGGLLTHLGMSPNASTQRVYQIYNEALSKNVGRLSAVDSIIKDFNEKEAAKLAAKSTATATKEVSSGIKGYPATFSKEEVAIMEKQGITPEMANKMSVQGGESTAATETIKANTPTDVPVAKTMSRQDATDFIVKELSSYMREPTRGGIDLNGLRVRPPMTDLRQLTTKDIQAALGLTKSEASDLGDAIMQSMLDVPLAVRGMGDRAVDIAQKIPGFNKYMQLQGAGRFAWNPFFKAKVSTKIEILAQAEAGGKFPTVAGTNWFLKRIFPDTYHQIDGMRDLLRQNGSFDSKPITGLLKGQGSVAEATDATGNILQEVGANLHQSLTVAQERSVSSLIMAQAKKAQMTGKDFIERNPQQVRDTIQAITHYDRNANFLNSPMARTLNYAFFPFRFETKVATIMGRSLGKADPMTQLAVISGLYKAHDFLNSPEGMTWYSQNSTVIKAFEYLTPIQTLSEVSNILGGKADSISAFGELGGLPFGFIPTMLDAAGLTNITQSAYLDPLTAKEYTRKVPANTRGMALVALQSLIGSLFSYPGSELGLPSKTSLTQSVAFSLGNKKTDLKTAPNLPLSQEQVKYQQAVQNLKGAPQNIPQTPVSSMNVPATQPTPPAPRSGSSSKSKSKKKADFRPALLPGQSTLGQL